MKKSSKKIQAPKGNLKISSFFCKQNNKFRGKETLDSKKRSKDDDRTILVVDSDDDFVPDTREKIKARSSKVVVQSENLKKQLRSPVRNKRKIEGTDIQSPPQKKMNIIVESKLSPDSQPSTSEYRNGITTPTKSSSKQTVFIKSPEKLLSPAALKEYNTPEKKSERFMDKIRTPTPKKLLFDNEINLPHKSTVKACDTLLSTVDELIARSLKKTPSKKNVLHIDKSSAMTTNNELSKIAERTPNKLKKTPKKLFDKSPNNLSDFNVQIIDNFVKITPSKNNKIDPDLQFVRSSEKKQSSILKYISPTSSVTSLQAQRNNESTPTKEPISSPKTPKSKSKVKTKLDFSECTPQSEQIAVSVPRNLQLMPSCSTSMTETGNSPNAVSPKHPKGNNRGQENNLNLVNVECSFFDDWHEEMVISCDMKYDLDLSEAQHCKIVAINPFATKCVVTLKSTKNGEQAICALEGFWIHTPLSIGDTVYVTAKKLNDDHWSINNDHGLLVYEPDLLISTTSVVNTLWCKRRSVLSDRFRGFEGTNQHMLVGVLVHSLLQHVLRNGITMKSEIEKVAKNLLKDRSIILNIYDCGVSMELIEEELMKFVPKIVAFLNLYVTNSNHNLRHNKDDWKGTIKTIEDIEENIWCPELGLKGKVDVSIKTELNTMPLELKTGRATVSLEHRGQVMMYIMMMNKLGYKVPSGLLLYLREGVLREIPTTQKEIRDIMIMRNELTYYLTRKTKVVEDECTKDKKLFPPELPEPINHPSCAKCPYNIICTAYAKYNNEDISSKKTLKNVQDEAFFYLEDSHLNYFMHWVSLIALESNLSKGSKDLREIYTVPPETRYNNGKCLINLEVSNIEEECNGLYAHTFESKSNNSGVNFFVSGIMESNYVVVSVDNRPAISAGFVTDITAKSITVTLDRNLYKKYANRTFYIDSYDSTSIQSFNLASLTLLLELTPRAEQLRGIIIDKKPPTFKSSLPKLIATKGKLILKRLNIVQQRAVLKAIAADDYFLIKGMPGTGKTATIVALIQLLVELNKSVLITSHTHSAVDNVCLRLVSHGVKLLRLGSESRIHSSLKEYSEHSLTKNCTTPEQLEAVYNSAQVLAVTCLGAGHPILSKRTMDICIVDESTQVVQSSLIRPLYATKAFILIGDPDQLPAVIKNKEAIEMGMSESLFERLYIKDATIALNLNYRMNSTITALANYLTYNGELLPGNESVANDLLKLPSKENLMSTYEDSHWIRKALDESIENAVQFLDTGPTWTLNYNVSWQTNRENVNDKNSKSENQSCVNIYEAAITVHLVHALLQAGVSSKDIGVIATYRAQVAQISILLQADNIDVSTVDQFQGKDKNVIIYTCARSKDVSVKYDNKFELLEDKRRLTVAITRAKNKLILIGDVSTLRQYSTFQKLMPYVEKNLIKLCETKDFNWETILNSIPRF